MTISHSKTLLVILQNAWGVNAEYYPAYEIDSFANSVTGRRLRMALPDNCKVVITNASMQIGDTADSVFPPDIEHVRAAINHCKPSVILACGVVAQQAIHQIEPNVPVISMWHPAHRCFSKMMAEAVKCELEGLL